MNRTTQDVARLTNEIRDTNDEIRDIPSVARYILREVQDGRILYRKGEESEKSLWI